MFLPPRLLLPTYYIFFTAVNNVIATLKHYERGPVATSDRKVTFYSRVRSGSESGDRTRSLGDQRDIQLACDCAPSVLHVTGFTFKYVCLRIKADMLETSRNLTERLEPCSKDSHGSFRLDTLAELTFIINVN